MDTKFCRTCGQANLPNETTCLKCGLNLGQSVNQTPSQNPFEKNKDPYKTIAVGQQEPKQIPINKTFPTKETEKSNSKLFLILGGVFAFVVIGGVLITALAGGIYFYTSSNNVIVDKSKPLTDESNDEKENKTTKEDEESDSVLTKMTNDDITKRLCTVSA